MDLIENFNPLKDKMIQALDPQGNIVLPELVPDWDDKKLREIYARMVMLRMADQKLISLQRQGRSGSYASIEGQEACQIGSGLALLKTDWVFPAFRELAIAYIHGVPLYKIYLYWMGNEWGSNYDARVAPVSIPVGSQTVHAMGFAWALKLQGKKEITISYFGDGATSEGDFYEAMNFAGLIKAPTIFFCQNNQWAISTPLSKQTATKTLAQKALACEIKGIQVDGNDIFAVYAVASQAAARARQGLGATLIEAVTYRLGNHTTSDDATKYRNPAEVELWKKRDPILRLKLFLQKKGLLDEKFEKEIVDAAEKEIREAVAQAENTPLPAPNEMFDYLYAEKTPQLLEQQQYLLKHLNKI